MLPDLRLQIAALTLAEGLNFTRAAERLSITQPDLSKRILELETHLGFLVFEKVQRKVELTDAGQVFILGCRDALAMLERAIREARTAHDEVHPPSCKIDFADGVRKTFDLESAQDRTASSSKSIA